MTAWCVFVQLMQICADSGTNLLLRFADQHQMRAHVSMSMQLAGSALISHLQGAARSTLFRFA